MKSGPSAERQVLNALNRIGASDLQEVVDLVQHICGTRAAAISVLESGYYHLVLTAGMEPLVCEASDALCSPTMALHSTVVVEDATRDERFQHSRYVDGTFMSLRFYASAPIYAPDNTMVGRLCVFDPAPKVLGALQEQALTTLAANVSKVLELRMRPDRVPQARQGRVTTAEDALRVAAQISHDLRIPLTALTTSLAMLDEAASEDGHAADGLVLGTARRAAERMTRMIDELLRLNDAGRVLDLTEVDLAWVVDQVLADIGALLQVAGAVVDVGPLPRVVADPDQLYRVVLNLVSNAVKFGRPDVPPVIRVRSRRLGHTWRISVIDNGCGIPATSRRDVFSMFTRLDSSMAGNGIGLATVRRVVESHGGRVGVEDAAGHGVELWFELPDTTPAG